MSHFIRCFRHYWQADPRAELLAFVWGLIAVMGQALVAIICLLWVKP